MRRLDLYRLCLRHERRARAREGLDDWTPAPHDSATEYWDRLCDGILGRILSPSWVAR